MTYYPQFSQGDGKLNASILNRIVRMLQWYEGQGRKVEIKKPERYVRRDRPGFWAIIIGNDPLGATNQWRYRWLEAAKASAGYGGWAPKPDGRQGISGDARAFNLVEANNNGVGLEGNGVNVDNLPGTFAVQPVASLTIVRMFSVTPPAAGEDSVVEYWFSYENAVDGTC